MGVWEYGSMGVWEYGWHRIHTPTPPYTHTNPLGAGLMVRGACPLYHPLDHHRGLVDLL